MVSAALACKGSSPGAGDLADHVDREGVALGCGAKGAGYLQQRRYGLVEGVAPGVVALGAD